MKIIQFSHVGVRALDRAASEAFYVQVLGLKQHPTKNNWLRTQDGEFSVHLMPGTDRSNDGNDVTDLARHFALETDDLEGVAKDLISAGYKPFQANITGQERRELVSSEDVTFGIGTIFVFDPDGNLIEFIDRTRGIFPQILADAS